MANTLSVLGYKSCYQELGNTGVQECFVDIKLISGILLVPKGTIITYAQAQTLKTTLATLTSANLPLQRAYPIKNFDELESVGSDATIKETGYGRKYLGKNATVGFKFTYMDGGMDLSKQLATFTDKQGLFDFFLIDSEENALYGTKVSTGIKGYSLGMFVSHTPTLSNEETKYTFEIHLKNADEFNKRFTHISSGSDYTIIDECNGLKQLEIDVATPLATGLVKLKLKTGVTDLYDAYSTNFIASLFSAKNVATNNAITITSVTPTALGKTFNVQLDTADTDYTLVASGGLIELSIGTVSALTAQNIIGMSEASVTLVK